MRASPFDFLRAGPPAPRVVLLPDTVFFSRVVPVPPAATRDEVVAQVGLALESLSPFPLPQLYYGYYWPDGADRALAFASYRRRFTVEQISAWSGTELVMPAFAAVLGLEATAATTVILSSNEGLTAVHWDLGPVPSLVLHQPVAPETDPSMRDLIRAQLIRSAGETTRVIDVTAAPIAVGGASDSEVGFEVAGLRARLPANVAASMDVRDKADLVVLAHARRRGVLLWRVATGSVAACLLFALGELSLFGVGFWQKARLAKIVAQKPTVAHILEEQELASRIDDLSTKRLLPLEMISVASPETALPKNPPAIQFLRATANTLDTIQIEAQTNNAGEIAGYKTALEQSTGVERVEIRDQRARDNVVTFTLIVTFKPGALAPAAT